MQCNADLTDFRKVHCPNTVSYTHLDVYKRQHTHTHTQSKITRCAFTARFVCTVASAVTVDIDETRIVFQDLYNLAKHFSGFQHFW